MTAAELAARLLAGTGVRVVSVVGFPHGGSTAETKVQEARQAVASGADEVDMVLNVGALKEGARDAVTLLAAGADLLGTSRTEEILRGAGGLAAA